MAPLDFSKILLVHPLGYKADDAGHDISRMANIMPPLGLASIAAYLEKNGIDAGIIDCYAKPQSDGLIEGYLRDARPAFIGMSCSTANFLDGLRIAKMAKDILPDIKVVFGGHHVSALKEKALEPFPVVDFAVVGEGEQTMVELMKAGGEDAARIGGLLYREKTGETRFNGYRPHALDLDTLPFPAYEKLDGYPDTYKLPIFNYPATPNSSCTSSRGCPYRCTYCDRSVFPTGYRYNSAEYLYEHFRYLHERFGIRHLNLYDDQFTFYRKRVETFTRMMVDRPLGMTFNCAVRAEHIDLAILREMKAAGCWMISLGIENGDEELLAQHRKNANLDLVAEKIRLIKKAGIRVKGLMMIGLPGETEQSVKKSMNYVFSLPIDDINVSKFTPFPGSALYEHIGELGTFDEDWEKMDCMHFQFIPKGMTKPGLERLFTLFYRKHFMRPKCLWQYVTMIWRSPDSWIRFLSNLTSFLKFAWTNKRHA
ncbi:MAG: B12-binding domain-containing radical SAM protein [Syntrophus sp. (in: bacteria)]|nr:B12-binding domain-containing radical SAM protein [Syntrophus sp. (in: bacteria)]